MPVTVIANWKMHGSRETARTLIEGLRSAFDRLPAGIDLIICPPFTLIETVEQALRGHRVRVGAQTCHYAKEGAFTGEISPYMLAEMGCTHVLVGHSERRQYQAESNDLIAQKLEGARVAGLKTVLCVGETLTQREQGQALDVVKQQLAAVNAAALADYVAYEPVWAIGSGKTPTEIDIAQMHSHIAAQLQGQPVLYGGSVKAENAEAILQIPAVAGALVGGASLTIDSFSQILHAAYQLN